MVQGIQQKTEHLGQQWFRTCKPWDFTDATICFKHIYNMILFHIHISRTKIEVVFQSCPRPTHSMGGTLLGLSGRWVLVQSSFREWFQFFLANLAVESQLNDWGRVHVSYPVIGSVASFLSSVTSAFSSDTYPTASHKTGLLHPLPTPPPSQHPSPQLPKQMCIPGILLLFDEF